MRKYLILFAILVGFCACGKEDELTPTGEGARLLTIPDKSGRFNELAYQIYTNTGMPIFVNDTLLQEERGVDYNGKPIIHYEMFVFGYEIFSTKTDATVALSADTTAMVKAAELIRDKVIPRFSQGYTPFCILMVDSLYTSYRGWNPVQDFLPSYGTVEYAYSDMMGVVVGYLADILKMTEDEQNTWAGRILAVQIAAEIQGRYKEDVTEFYRVSKKDERWTWHGASLYAELDGTPVSVGYDKDYRELGFLELIYKGQYSATRLVKRYPSEDIDVVGYIAAVYAFSEEKFEKLYKDFPLCIEKYKLMKAIVAKFEAEIKNK